jgi:Ser/Thr protein kinase RdoA (MazF antagonist)
VTDLPASLTPLEGGHSGRTFVGEAGGERVVVRLYPPGSEEEDTAPEKDAAVLALVRGLLPVADVLDVRRGDEAAGVPGLLVTSWLPGERGDLVLDGLDADGRARLGREMGRVAAALAGMPMLRPGPFIDAELTLGRFPDGGLAEWIELRLDAWTEPGRERLVRVAEPAQDLLDSVGRASLVHSDLNPKNVLVDPRTCAITGIVDWEFAHAGHPWTDLGNVLRFDREEAYVRAALEAWSDLHGGTPADLLEGARAADLWALVDLAARAGENPVASRAHRLLRAIADSGDLHAH